MTDISTVSTELSPVPSAFVVATGGILANNRLLSAALQASVTLYTPDIRVGSVVKTVARTVAKSAHDIRVSDTLADKQLQVQHHAKTLANELYQLKSSVFSQAEAMSHAPLLSPLNVKLGRIPPAPIPPPEAVLAWGMKPSAAAAKTLADELNLPLWTTEDGFLRSLDSGTKSRYGASFIIDDLGIYFDARKVSRLELLIAHRKEAWTIGMQARSEALMASLATHELSKYNPYMDETAAAALSAVADGSVLVIDQVAGDASIAGALASESSFYQMLATACQNHPNAPIVIKAHPAGKSGFLVDELGELHGAAAEHLTAAGVSEAHVQILAVAVNPIALLKKCSSVYSVSSHLGFEALLLGKTVHSFGLSWYAGFGLTDDDFKHLPADLVSQALARRAQSIGVTLAQLFYAAYIDYSHYADPATGKACDIEIVIDYLLLNRAWQARLAGNILAFDFSRWKLPFVRGYSDFPATDLQFKHKTRLRLLLTDKKNNQRIERDRKKALSALDAKSSQRYLVWGLAMRRLLSRQISEHQPNTKIMPNIIIMEDGFIRSNGLGATLLEPLSVVMDDIGVYYDATHPSRLEQILTEMTISEAQALQAQALRAVLLKHKVSKYNVGDVNDSLSHEVRALKAAKPSASIRLVVGQVEDDASVKNCASLIKTNADLLKRVRADFPDDIIIYKPHPDIEAGIRVGKVDDETLKLADAIAYDTAMPVCLDIADAVHTISSLTGFEALLRDVAVVCYGMPFYAGFGLTTDADSDTASTENPAKAAAIMRRQRSTPLSLEALIYGVLIDYPAYRLPHSHGLANVFDVVHYLYLDAPVNAPQPLKRRIKQVAKARWMQLRHQWLSAKS